MSCQISRLTGIPRRTICDWRQTPRLPRPTRAHTDFDFSKVPHESYAYVLGLYLGDGHITRCPRTWRLRISLDLRWKRLILMCADAMDRVFPRNRVLLVLERPFAGCAVVSVYSSHLPLLFPQHGPGMKHLRKIELADWQQEIVDTHTELFLRGLIHSDGCRFINRVRVGGKAYEYPRYNFTNASADIRKLFTDGCDRLGVQWRRMNERNISVARRESVARLDEFIGPKH